MDKIATAADVPFRPQPGGHLVKFNLQDADLAELVNHISGLTGKRFIYGAKVRQIKATVVSPEPVTLEEAYQAFLSILDANGMTVVPHGRFLKIVDSGGVVTQPTPVISRGEPVPDSDRFVTRLYRLEHVGTDEALALLGKFKSKDGDISVYTPGKLLIVTDTATQVRRLMRIVEEIDVGGSGQHMWIEPVRNGTAHRGPFSATTRALDQTWIVTKGTIAGLKNVVTPQGAKQLTTPVGIVQSSSDAVTAGYYPGLLAFISLALAIFNLLPFLPLDGGHILFALAEKVYRRPIPRVVFERVSVVGIVLMLMLFTVGLNNDIGRLGGP